MSLRFFRQRSRDVSYTCTRLSICECERVGERRPLNANAQRPPDRHNKHSGAAGGYRPVSEPVPDLKNTVAGFRAVIKKCGMRDSEHNTR